MNTVFALMLALSPSDIDVENAVQIAQIPELLECQEIAKAFKTSYVFCVPFNIRHVPDWEPIIRPYNLINALETYNLKHP